MPLIYAAPVARGVMRGAKLRRANRAWYCAGLHFAAWLAASVTLCCALARRHVTDADAAFARSGCGMLEPRRGSRRSGARHDGLREVFAIAQRRYQFESKPRYPFCLTCFVKLAATNSPPLIVACAPRMGMRGATFCGLARRVCDVAPWRDVTSPMLTQRSRGVGCAMQRLAWWSAQSSGERS